MVILVAQEGEKLRCKMSSLSFSIMKPLAHYADRMLPFVSYRLASAIRIQKRGTHADEFQSTTWWMHVLSISSVVQALGIVQSLWLRDAVWLVIGLVCAALYPISRYKRELNAAATVRDQITYDLPEFVQVIVIYLFAGLTVATAIHSVGNRWRNKKGVLPSMIREAAGRLQAQMPLTHVLHQMAGTADTSDMKSVVTILLTHTTRGGDATLDTLLDISKQMWNKRLSLVRKKAEETSVKMIFPLILIFVAILMIVGAPAVIFVSS